MWAIYVVVLVVLTLDVTGLFVGRIGADRQRRMIWNSSVVGLCALVLGLASLPALFFAGGFASGPTIEWTVFLVAAATVVLSAALVLVLLLRLALKPKQLSRSM